jgi:hypothetical protein
MNIIQPQCKECDRLRYEVDRYKVTTQEITPHPSYHRHARPDPNSPSHTALLVAGSRGQCQASQRQCQLCFNPLQRHCCDPAALSRAAKRSQDFAEAALKATEVTCSETISMPPSIIGPATDPNRTPTGPQHKWWQAHAAALEATTKELTKELEGLLITTAHETYPQL